MKSPLIVANWKAYFSYQQTFHWLKKYIIDLNIAIKTTNNKLIICPSFDTLHLMKDFCSSTMMIQWGAQDCCHTDNGPYTGQVLAQSLKELGCSYTIIGHSELLNYCHISPDIIAQKAQQLEKNSITPIICLGESPEEYEKKLTKKVLEQQLTAFITYPTTLPLIIAYEPIWAINTGKVPDADYLHDIAEFIKKKSAEYQIKIAGILYGGSIDEKNITILHNLTIFDGFLVGHASTDFQSLKKIVISIY